MDIDDENLSEDDRIELAKWTRKYINSLPNSSFAAIEPDYLNGKTDNKNARHLPYKDSSGKVDLPHLRNARARMNQIKPVTKSISTEALRAKAKRVLDAAAAKHLKPPKKGKKLEVEDLFTLSTGRKVEIDFVEEHDDHTLIKFELIDNETYNGVYFSKDAIEHQYEQFQKKEFTVSHGMDHTRKTLDQLGEVVDMELKYEGKDNSKVRAFITSKIFKETNAQKEAHILMGQELLNYISGGWSGKISFDYDKIRFEIIEPNLRESSSTPTPAKRDAKVQNAMDFIMSENQAINLEESNMTDKEENQENTEPSQEGEEVVEQDAELTTLKKEMQAEIDAMKAQTEEYKQATADVKANLDEQQKGILLERAKELGLPEEQFEGKTSEEIKFALEVANKVKMDTLRERDPSTQFGGEGDVGLVDGSDEMITKLEKEFFDWGDLEDDTLEGL